MRARELRRILEKRPLRYSTDRQAGSHTRLVSSEGYPPLTFAFHDAQSLPGSLVKEILMDAVGLSENEARDLL